MRLALVLTSVLVVTAIVAAAVRSPSGKVVTATARRTAVDHRLSSPLAALPRFFADTQGSGEGNGPLQIRETGHGRTSYGKSTRVYQFRRCHRPGRGQRRTAM